MNTGNRLRSIICATAVALAAGFSSLAAAAEDPRWQELKPAFFGDRAIEVDSGIIALETPSRAHDAAVVPIVMTALDPERQIRRVHLIVDKNPLPLAGIFNFSEAAGNWESVETRIRINEYTNVRAVAELSDGSLHMASNFVKAAGGCSAPAMADMTAAMSRAGRMKVLLGKLDAAAGVSSPATEGASVDATTITAARGSASTEATIKISHPNNSGMQFDQVSRNYIPAFYVNRIGASMNGQPLLDVETNFSLSENPVVRLNFTPEFEQSELVVFVSDSKGNHFEQSAAMQSGSLTMETPATQQ